MVVAVVERQLPLLRGAGRADDRGAERLGPLAEEEPDTAGGRVTEQDGVGTDVVDLSEQVLHRHPLEHHRGRDPLVDLVRQADESVRRDDHPLGVGPHRPASVGHPVADGQPSPGADRLDHAGGLHAEPAREPGGVQAGAEVGVDEVQADGGVAHEDLARSGIGDVDLDPVEHLGAAGAFEADGVGAGHVRDNRRPVPDVPDSPGRGRMGHPAPVPLAVLAVVVGLALLTKAADEFVAGAARLSAALAVPPVIIGAVVVGFGTSAPEMVVSGISSTQGKLDIAAGNIIGSNVANLSLVLGVSALLCIMAVDSSILRREAPLSTGSVVLFAVLVQDGLQRWEGVVLLVALAGALVYLFTGPRGGSEELASEVDEFFEDERTISVRRESLRTLLGLVGVIAGAQLAIVGASDIAAEFGLAEGFVGLTLIALGTSLPELTTAIAAARKQEEELIIGNLLGSNLFNSLGVGAVAGLLGPGSLDDPHLAGVATVIMVGVAVAAWLFMVTGKRVQRSEAIVLLAVYAISLPLLAS